MIRGAHEVVYAFGIAKSSNKRARNTYTIYWLFAECIVLKWSVRARMRDFNYYNNDLLFDVCM